MELRESFHKSITTQNYRGYFYSFSYVYGFFFGVAVIKRKFKCGGDFMYKIVKQRESHISDTIPANRKSFCILQVK